VGFDVQYLEKDLNTYSIEVYIFFESLLQHPPPQ